MNGMFHGPRQLLRPARVESFPRLTRCRRGLLLLALLGLAATSAPCGAAQPSDEESPSCGETRHVQATEYWFWTAYEGLDEVSESAGQRRGHLADHPEVCIVAPIGGLDDRLVRTRGYKEALHELFKSVPSDAARWNTDAGWSRGLARLERMAGRDFRSRRAWSEWWQASADYLVWSPVDQHLIVDEVAKVQGRVVVDMNPLQDVPASQYWYYHGMNWLKDLRETGDYVYARAWTGETDLPIRVARQELTDRDQKTAGYHRAVERQILEFVGDATLENNQVAPVMARLRETTSERFQERQEWLLWWSKNEHRLVLSRDGQHLTAALTELEGRR